MIDLEVTIEGPGGHAWTACERVSAIHAAGLAIAEIAKIVPPKDPKTTLTVSLIEGGQAPRHRSESSLQDQCSFKFSGCTE